MIRSLVIVIGILAASLTGIAASRVATLVNAFTETSGAVEAADPQALASARAKLVEQVVYRAAFRLELTEDEITAVLQDGLEESGAPFQRVVIKLVGAANERGHIEFNATFRNGDLAMRGRADLVLDAGMLRVKLRDVDLGAIGVPGLAKRAVEDLINPFAKDLLTSSGTAIQSVTLADHKVVIVGTQAGGKVLSSATLVAGLRQQVLSSSNAVEPPRERLGPGVVDGREAEGSSYYVALGDSLAASEGVTEARDGYVSRFHNQLQRRDGVPYGLRNFGVSGETSASLIRGQLDAALEFMRSHDVRYITLDIGANDLLGHVGRVDCADGLSTPVCRKCMADAFTAYAANLQRVFNDLRAAAPGATLVFLQTYNPFSLGFGSRVALEGESDRLVREFNALAARLARSHGVLVADGFTPMQGTTAATTHVLDNPPDIHPRAIGHDILAAALLDALPRGNPVSQVSNPPAAAASQQEDAT